MRVVEILEWGAEQLKQAGVEEYELDARLLLEEVLGKSRTELYLAAANSVCETEVDRYNSFILRRAKREPVAYILGQQEFWSLPFFVTPGVLIPRPETEFLLEQVFSRANPENFQSGKIVDICCGSGVIATILAKETGKIVCAIDISDTAIAVTRHNLETHGVINKVFLLQGDLLTPLHEEENLSLVVSNPPYVSHIDVLQNLEPEVSDYEPHLALDGGNEGLELIIRIRRQLEKRLISGGELFMEIGAEQGRDVHDIFASRTGDEKGFRSVEILNDYAGRNRVVHAVKN